MLVGLVTNKELRGRRNDRIESNLSMLSDKSSKLSDDGVSSLVTEEQYFSDFLLVGFLPLRFPLLSLFDRFSFSFFSIESRGRRNLEADSRDFVADFKDFESELCTDRGAGSNDLDFFFRRELFFTPPGSPKFCADLGRLFSLTDLLELSISPRLSPDLDRLLLCFVDVFLFTVLRSDRGSSSSEHQQSLPAQRAGAELVPCL